MNNSNAQVRRTTNVQPGPTRSNTTNERREDNGNYQQQCYEKNGGMIFILWTQRCFVSSRVICIAVKNAHKMWLHTLLIVYACLKCKHLVKSMSTFHSALTLDIHTLSLLLERNHHQHRRCKYYQRLLMVLSSLRRLLPPSTFDDVNDWMGELKRNVRLLLEDGNGMNAHNNDKRRVKEEEQWTLEKKDDDHTIKIISHYQQKDNDDSVHGINLRKQLLQRISTIVQQLKILATSSIPEIISRITHATSPILHELSRGYFVPFLTIALACLGRIHNLLLIMGREVVSALQETVPQLRELCQQKGALGISSSDTNSIVDWKELENIVMPTFVGKRQNINNNNNVNTKTCENSASQEWNDLMTQFVEVSHEELTKQTNDFIKGKRWDDCSPHRCRT